MLHLRCRQKSLAGVASGVLPIEPEFDEICVGSGRICQREELDIWSTCVVTCFVNEIAEIEESISVAQESHANCLHM